MMPYFIRDFLRNYIAPMFRGVAIAVLFLGAMPPLIYVLAHWFKYWLGKP